ncbi:hypothetical protein KGF54_000010 [Candida jiufengensis]|uniref:uncharacterized protein n=1 Tax=Candida jiufengensis TaxID=497108 RepID=UPI002224B358|nr:uncharacterized protein KGF54_000010 [Candida jiufengensis]KAI5957082.1 hypothetical protein KGF54_000010 [Candida jiufengensis]
MSSRSGKVIVAGVAIAASWWFGINFWKPLVLEQLDKDGNLRKDYNYEKPEDELKNWNDLKQKWKAFENPEKNFSKDDKLSLEHLKERLEQNKPKD